jgi:hypothetical protein
MRNLLVLLAAASGLFLAAPAEAQVRSELQLLMTLNGTPSKVGNAATATPFTLTLGNVYMGWCDADAYVQLNGATAHATASNANAGMPVTSKTPFFWVARSTAISAVGSAAFNCAVYLMVP